MILEKFGRLNSIWSDRKCGICPAGDTSFLTNNKQQDATATWRPQKKTHHCWRPLGSTEHPLIFNSVTKKGFRNFRDPWLGVNYSRDRDFELFISVILGTAHSCDRDFNPFYSCDRDFKHFIPVICDWVRLFLWSVMGIFLFLWPSRSPTAVIGICRILFPWSRDWTPPQ